MSMDGSSESGHGQPAAGGTANPGATSSLSHLPWSMIPAFKPGETDINEYSKKLEFISALWPEHLSLLAPRAAMLCEGSAFKRIMRLDTTKLRVNSAEGVKLLVTSLGGIWGRSTLEEKFERFERAIFTTVQRADESHESYLARHDYQFEELLQMNVGFPEIRAYLLLRNSGLGPEDKKKLVVDANGVLQYDSIASALKLLGSRFFHEVQGSKLTSRTKTYDVNAAFEDENPWTPGQQDEDAVLLGEAWDENDLYADDTDPDAVVCMQFEDSIVEALQCDSELAVCYNAYLDARRRLTDRNKNRGFWGNQKGGSKGKGKGKTKNNWKFRKPLAQRILESERRRCHQKGHWKAECPLLRSSSSAPAVPKDGAFTGNVTTMESGDANDDADMIEITEVETASDLSEYMEDQPDYDEITHIKTHLREHCVNHVVGQPSLTRFVNDAKKRLSPQGVNRPEPTAIRNQPRSTADAFFVSHGPFGIVDLGASQTVIGRQQYKDLTSHMPLEFAQQIREVPCQTVFRFGNSSTVTCQSAILAPLHKRRVKICIVEPRLLS